MDPLSALGLAGNIITFVQFAGALFSGAQQIRLSADGASEEIATIEDIYAKPASFSSGLKVEPRHSAASSGSSNVDDTQPSFDLERFSPWTRARKLAASCESDCNRLLAIVRKLKIKTRSGFGLVEEPHAALCEGLEIRGNQCI